MSLSNSRGLVPAVARLACLIGFAPTWVLSGEFDTALINRVDEFVAGEMATSGIPGIALAIVDEHRTVHVRGFGSDGRGNMVTENTPFPIGSLTKSLTALVVRQLIESGQLDADAQVQRYLSDFRVADATASGRITLRHLLNQTSGFSRSDGMAPLISAAQLTIEELVRGLSTVSLNRPVGERYEYSNLNFVLLGAVAQKVTGKSWATLVGERVLQPLAMTRSYADYSTAKLNGMTAVHRVWFGAPVVQELVMQPGLTPAGGIAASANDMANYLRMMLAGGAAPTGRVLSSDGVVQLLAPASPTAKSHLLSADFEFRYGEGWFVGPFGAAQDARWHLGALPSFAAWMVLLPETKQAVAVLINANCELPINEVNAVMSRLPIGVVNLLRGQPVPKGPSMRSAYGPFNTAVAVVIGVLVALAWWTTRGKRKWLAWLMVVAAALLLLVPNAVGISVLVLRQFAPDLALTIAACIVLLVIPAMLQFAHWLGSGVLRQQVR